MKFFPIAASFLVLIILTSGCSSNYYRKQADREVAAIIQAKGDQVPGLREDFDLVRNCEDLLASLPVAPPEARLSNEIDSEQHEASLLNLENALRIAAANSREYQLRKENVFFQALNLTGERDRFTPRFFWNMRGNLVYTEDSEWELEGQSGPAVQWLLSTGARLSVELSTAATAFLTGDREGLSSSVFDLTLAQPLWRERRIAVIEPLTQAERNMIYELRDFVRFQRRFLTGVLIDYYRILEQRQRVENEQINYDNLVRVRQRSEALGRAGRIPEMQVDRARQDELAVKDNLEQAKQSYRSSLDAFKITLGLSPETYLLLNPSELEDLRERELTPPPLAREECIRTALANRLDLVTEEDKVEDALRKTAVAANALKPGLDLILQSTLSSERNRPLSFADGESSGYLSLSADLPLERTSERNTYRRALIEYERAIRNVEEKRHNIIIEIRERWRDFERAASAYEIRGNSVELAEERVESTEMLFEAGRATTRDVLDAHEDLLRAQNQLVQAMVDFRISSLQLERDMDILVVDEKGRLLEGLGYNEFIGDDSD